MKIVWIAPYPINSIINKKGIFKQDKSHSCSWVVNLENEFNRRDEFELHILTITPKVKKYKYIEKGNIHFHIIKNGIPYVKRGFPSWFPIEILLLNKLILKKIFYIVNLINPDVIHVFGTEKGYGLITLYTKKPVLISIQGIVSKISPHSRELKLYFQKRVEKKIISINKYFGCRTNFDKKFVKRINNNAKIFYLSEAINPIYFLVKWDENSINTNIITFVGSICQRKGVFELLQAIKILKENRLIFMLKIIGGGKMKFTKKMKKYIRDNNISELVEFVGICSPHEIAKVLSTTKYFILPSYIENSPNSLAEAMAVGVPSIATNVGGINSIIDDGINGFLINPKDPLSIVNIIKKTNNDKKLLINISQNAIKQSLSLNLPENIYLQTKSIYSELKNN